MLIHFLQQGIVVEPPLFRSEEPLDMQKASARWSRTKAQNHMWSQGFCKLPGPKAFSPTSSVSFAQKYMSAMNGSFIALSTGTRLKHHKVASGKCEGEEACDTLDSGDSEAGLLLHTLP